MSGAKGREYFEEAFYHNLTDDMSVSPGSMRVKSRRSTPDSQ